MSIQSEINRIRGNVANAYSAVAGMGGTVPQSANSGNLAGSIRSIPQGAQNVFLVNIEYVSGAGVTSVDQTYSDILDAYSDEQLVAAKVVESSSGVTYTGVFHEDQGDCFFSFVADAYKGTADAYLVTIGINSFNAATLTERKVKTGATSWNELTDRPFYEETLPAISIAQPDYTSEDAVSFNASVSGFTVPCKAVRVADYLPQNRVVGATIGVTSVINGNTEGFTSEITDEDCVLINHGYMCWPAEMPYVFVTDQDQTTVAMSDESLQLSVTLPTAGVYFVYMDLTELLGVITYPNALTKAAQTVVHKLDSRFLDTGNILIDATCTSAQLFSGFYTAFLANGTVAAAMAQSNSFSRPIFLQLALSDAGTVYLIPIQIVNMTVDGNGNPTPSEGLGSINMPLTTGQNPSIMSIIATVGINDALMVRATLLGKELSSASGVSF